MSTNYTFTSESVTEGHPDKMADQVSDSVLDAILAEDPAGRVACETLLTTGLVVVAGEITTSAYVDIPKIARRTICEIGYDRESYGFDGNTCGVIVSIDEQSPDIAQGVDTAYEVRSGKSGEDIINAQGAGDQGMMFGYACDETPDLMPMPIWFAHRLAERLAQVRKAGVLPYLRPDGKTQVSIRYEDGRPVALETVLISTQHQAGLDIETLLKPDLKEHVIHPLLPAEFASDKFEVFANPTGNFEIGGPAGDTGLTGRKIIVDTYGGAARHGGGAFSGKDPSKVDRSAAYAARWVAKHVVASGAARRCEIQVAYAIGVARPMSVMVETFGTAEIDPVKISDAVQQVFDLRPAAIVRGSRSAPSDLPQDGRLRSLRSLDEGLHLGRDFSSRRTEERPQHRVRVVRVLPDVPAIDKLFDYCVPPAMDGDVRVGTIVRIPLHGRRVGGWVVADGVEPPAGVSVRPLAKVTGWGPPSELVELSSWAAWRWAGRRPILLRSASPPNAVRGLPSPSRSRAPAATLVIDDPLVTDALARPRSVVRLAPAVDPIRYVEAASGRTDAVVDAVTGRRGLVRAAACSFRADRRQPAARSGRELPPVSTS